MSNRGGDVVALVPAAGSGSRMGSHVPKQYLPITHETVLQCTLTRINSVPCVSRIVVVVSATEVQKHAINDEVHITTGGCTRAESVMNGLRYIREQLSHTGLVLVHDAARPCVRVSDISRLIAEVGSSSHGGILAVPVHDTLKRGDGDARISATVDRHDMWRAVTPQLFYVEKLLDALQQADRKGLRVTDEASAMELAGYRPLLVAGAQDNIKITVADDLSLARTILKSQESL